MGLDGSRIKNLYLNRGLSVAEISGLFNCSESAVNYWLSKMKVRKRSISEAVYLKHNPSGDPFLKKTFLSAEEHFLLGLGLGLYWGEGTKSDKCSVRLGNTDPGLIKSFIKFLKRVYNIKSDKLKFGLQLFSDISPQRALGFWVRSLGVSPKQFQKVVVTKKRGLGTYTKKIEHGVLTVYFNNKKLRDIICGEIDKLR
ncbi:MAG: hypothetical protein U9M92_03505 [Patescibacteria group bacterium]|nr:hypothetical protein [Patescibacteria group bacterium]